MKGLTFEQPACAQNSIKTNEMRLFRKLTMKENLSFPNDVDQEGPRVSKGDIYSKGAL